MCANRTPPIWAETPRRPGGLGHRLLYAVSLPERLLRTLAGWAGGLVRLVAGLLPRPVRESRFFRVAVDKQLRLLIESVGGASVYPQEVPADQGYLPRKIVGSTVDNFALIAFRASPIWMLLAAADVVKGGAAYTRELVDELKKGGILDARAKIASIDDLLGNLADLSGRMAETLDTPPLNVQDLRRTVAELRAQAGKTQAGLGRMIPTAEDLGRLLGEMRAVAAEQHRSLLEVSTGMALHVLGKAERLATGTAFGVIKGLEVGARMAYREVALDYFRSLEAIRREGLYRSVYRTWQPYLRATRRNLAPEKLTWTELALTFGRLRRAAWRLR
ncbi:MAG: hypothetical protein JXQ29_11885 [Planctomycetes bacterium]|nr:hypothetical protein [Planctomycetota bacterium]